MLLEQRDEAVVSARTNPSTSIGHAVQVRPHPVATKSLHMLSFGQIYISQVAFQTSIRKLKTALGLASTSTVLLGVEGCNEADQK